MCFGKGRKQARYTARIIGIGMVMGIRGRIKQTAEHLLMKVRPLTCRRKNRELLVRYFDQAGPRKLQIGSGTNRLEGWLNTDYTLDRETFFLDASASFAFEDDTFDFVYSEHMIEHIEYAHGRRMLRECFRVMKPGGVLRIVTPDLLFLFNLYQNPGETPNADYIRWACETWIADRDGYAPAFVVNNFVRAWSHQFIYDEQSLRALFTSAGFDEVERAPVLLSSHSDLNFITNASRMPDGFFELESFAMEARKPF